MYLFISENAKALILVISIRHKKYKDIHKTPTNKKKIFKII